MKYDFDIGFVILIPCKLKIFKELKAVRFKILKTSFMPFPFLLFKFPLVHKQKFGLVSRSSSIFLLAFCTQRS